MICSVWIPPAVAPRIIQTAKRTIKVYDYSFYTRYVSCDELRINSYKKLQIYFILSAVNTSTRRVIFSKYKKKQKNNSQA